MRASRDGPTGVWLEHADAARAMWDEGLSASAIAARVGHGCTKSAIVGYGHRHGWPPRPSPIPVNGVRPTVAVPHKPPPPKAPKVATPRPPKAPKPPKVSRRSDGLRPAPAPPPKVVASPRTCQWIPEDCNARPWRFCGAPTVPGSPYCPEHHARAYTRRSTLAEAA